MQDLNRPKFPAGSAVHVRRGAADCDDPVLPFGGWVGRVVEVQEDACTMCLVRWSPETLAAVSPVFKGRWDFTETWLDEDDLESDEGKPAPLEEPTATLVSDNDQDDRLRSIFGLFNSDPLPRVCLDALRTYHEHLGVRLSFPFAGGLQRGAESGPGTRSMTVVRLFQRAGINDSDRILCRAVDARGARGVPLAAVRVAANSPNAQLIEDYCYWLRKCR